MNVLFVGDIVGSSGRQAFAQGVAAVRRRHEVDVVVANAENAAAGRGLTLPLAEELFSAGADALTLGDHVWDQKDLVREIGRETRIARAANLAPGCPGAAWSLVSKPAGTIAVINLLGRVFMPPVADCPFRAIDDVLRRLPPTVRCILVDMHAEATSEKIAMGWHLNGRVSVVVGSHTHVQTSDETVLPKGTAYITDGGMTGPRVSVLGREVAPVLQKFITGMPQKMDVAGGPAVMEGVLVDIHDASGRAKSIRRIRESFDEARSAPEKT